MVAGAPDLKPEVPYSRSDSAVPRGGAIAPPRGGGTARRNSACCAGDMFNANLSRFKVGYFTMQGIALPIYYKE